MKKDRCKIRLSSKKKYLYISKFFLWGRSVVVILNSDEQWIWKSCTRTFPFCLAIISGPHVRVPWGGWTLVTRPDRYCPPEESTFHDPPENKARTVFWTQFICPLSLLPATPFSCLSLGPYRAFCAEMVPWWCVRCHFETTENWLEPSLTPTLVFLQEPRTQ